MTDREKVLKGLECLITNETPCEGCPYNGSGYCMKNIAKDARELMKEQEAVKPRVSTVEQRCGNCNKVIEMDGWKACPWCGKPILWEGR